MRLHRLEALESRQLLSAAPFDAGVQPAAATSTDYQNQSDPLDVNNSDSIEPLDALIVINDLNANGPRTLPAPTSTVQYYIDTNGDGAASSGDALQVVNYLNAQDGAAAHLFGPSSLAVSQGGLLPLVGAAQIRLVDSDAVSTQSVAFALTSGKIEYNTQLSGVTVTTGANDSSSMTLSGNLNSLKAALASLVYIGPTAGGVTSDTITAKATNGLTSDSLTIQVAVSADAQPSVTGPTALTASQGNPVGIATPSIQIADADAVKQTESVTLTAGQGTLSINPFAANVTVSPSTPLGGDTLTLSGQLDQLNLALSTLNYTALEGTATGDMLNVVADDGFQKSNSYGLPITIVTDKPPTVTGPTQTQNVTQGNPFSAFTQAIKVSDNDSASETVTLQVQHGTITVNQFAALSVSVSAGKLGTGTFTLTGNVKNVNTVLGTLVYTPPKDSSPSDVLTVIANDGTLTSNLFSLEFVIAADVAPVVAGPAPFEITQAATVNVLSASSPASIAISDPDSANVAETITLKVKFGTLAVGGFGSETVTGQNTATLVLTGSLATLNTALGYLQYTGSPTSISVDTLTAVANDGIHDSNTFSLAITVLADVAPTISGPTTVAASAGTANAIGSYQVNDIDATSDNGQIETVTLHVASGALSFTPNVFSNLGYKGNNSDTLQLTGTLAQVNSALTSLVFTAPQATGPVQMTISPSDGVASGNVYNVAITVN